MLLKLIINSLEINIFLYIFVLLKKLNKLISEEIKNKNLQLFFKKLSDVGVNTDILQQLYGDKLLNATYAMQLDTNLAYEGSLINTLLRVLTPLAININNLLSEDKKCDNNIVIKIALLHQIAKCTMFEHNTNQWEVDNRGMAYKYAKYDAAIKLGARSIAICSECGIKLSPIEIEAMLINDRDDDQSRYFSNVLSNVIKNANELTNLQTK